MGMDHTGGDNHKKPKRNEPRSEAERRLRQRLETAGVTPEVLVNELGLSSGMASQLLSEGRGLNGLKYLDRFAALLKTTVPELFSNGDGKADTTVIGLDYHGGNPSSSPGAASNATFENPSPSGTAPISPDQLDPEALADAETLRSLAKEAKRIAIESERVAYKIVRRQTAIARSRQSRRSRKHRGLG
jgi:transcriptional regulator with XRE-family HTH domain